MKDVYLSVYESDITYRFRNFRFYFSSKVRQERFIKGSTLFIEEEKMKFRNKYRIPINDETFEEMLSCIYYMRCEKRGFRADYFEDSKLICTFYDLPTFKINICEVKSDEKAI